MERRIDRSVDWSAVKLAAALRTARQRFSDRVLAGTGIAVLVTVVALMLLLRTASTHSEPVLAPQVFDAVVTTTTRPTVTVHVAGAVRVPGLYRLPEGSRIADAIEAAGGVDSEVDIDRVNLAATIADGARIDIARLGVPNPDPPVLQGGEPGSPSASGPVDLNTATQQQLEALPGIGPSTATAIIDQRRRLGRFERVEDLLDVRGIGEAKLGQLRALVVVH